MKIEELIENEWYVVRHSGETPEIALHSALYYLTRAKDGPKVTLIPEQLKELQNAAVIRFSEIILRDLLHENAEKSIYRGVERSIVNYKRYLRFCERQKLDNQLKEAVGQQFCDFLEKESSNLTDKQSETIINCPFAELNDFAELLEVDCSDTLKYVMGQLIPCLSPAESVE